MKRQGRGRKGVDANTVSTEYTQFFCSVRGEDVKTELFLVLTDNVGSNRDVEYSRVFSGRLEKGC